MGATATFPYNRKAKLRGIELGVRAYSTGFLERPAHSSATTKGWLSSGYSRVVRKPTNRWRTPSPLVETVQTHGRIHWHP